MRRAILILSLLGASVFAGAFFLSYAQPLLVERAATTVLRIEIEREVGARLDAQFESGIVAFAQRALGRTDAQIARTRQQLREDVEWKVGEVVSKMLDPDCTCRQRLQALARQWHVEKLRSLQQAREQLQHVVESAYATVRRDLLREFRIFTASNAIAFALLALVALLRKRANLQLLLPALAISGAVLVSASLYLFNQDWLQTIVLGDYVGWGYAMYLSTVALLLADILMNHARVTTHVVNAALNVAGAAASAVPC